MGTFKSKVYHVEWTWTFNKTRKEVISNGKAMDYGPIIPGIEYAQYKKESSHGIGGEGINYSLRNETQDLWKICANLGHDADVYITLKLSKWRKQFAFL